MEQGGESRPERRKDMTHFEEFAKELGVEITTGANGLYTGMAQALAQMTTETILSDDDEVFELDWEQQKELVKEKFYKAFPYMKSRVLSKSR